MKEYNVFSIIYIVSSVLVLAFLVRTVVVLAAAGRRDGVKKVMIKPLAVIIPVMIIASAITLGCLQPAKLKSARSDLEKIEWLDELFPEEYYMFALDFIEERYGETTNIPQIYLAVRKDECNNLIISSHNFILVSMGLTAVGLAGIAINIILVTSRGLYCGKFKEAVPITGKYINNEIHISCITVDDDEKTMVFRATPKNMSAFGSFIEWDEQSKKTDDEHSADNAGENL